MRALVIGGSSGLGLAIAGILKNKNKYQVFITGRRNPGKSDLHFQYLDLKGFVDDYLPSDLDSDLDITIRHFMPLDLLVYSAGFYQDGTLDELDDYDIRNMINVGLVAPALLLSKILKKQRQLSGFIAITSTSQFIPRLREPVYTAVKAGLGMLAHSVSLDPRIAKTLVVAPAGMNTNFWNGVDISKKGILLESDWIAEQIMDLFQGEFKYKLARILREPSRVEILDERKL